MPKPITPMCGCDVFVVDAQRRVLLIRRADNGFWALPGGCQNLDDTAMECAARECLEESGYEVKITALLGVWSSLRYEYVNFPYKDNVFSHLVFSAEVTGGSPKTSDETSSVGWFGAHELPELSDGHDVRIKYGFRWLDNPELPSYFE